MRNERDVSEGKEPSLKDLICLFFIFHFSSSIVFTTREVFLLFALFSFASFSATECDRKKEGAPP